jgi:hypothetical protein
MPMCEEPQADCRSDAQGADMKDGNGRIFFTSPLTESELKQLLEVQQQP